jgi:hypothetical protein
MLLIPSKSFPMTPSPLRITLGLLCGLLIAACQSSSAPQAPAADSTSAKVSPPGVHPDHGNASIWEAVVAVQFVWGGSAASHQLRITYPDYNSFNLMAEDLPLLVELNGDGQSFRLRSKADGQLAVAKALDYPADPSRVPVLDLLFAFPGQPACDLPLSEEKGTPIAVATGWQEGKAQAWALQDCRRFMIDWDESAVRITTDAACDRTCAENN